MFDEMRSHWFVILRDKVYKRIDRLIKKNQNRMIDLYLLLIDQGKFAIFKRKSLHARSICYFMRLTYIWIDVI